GAEQLQEAEEEGQQPQRQVRLQVQLQQEEVTSRSYRNPKGPPAREALLVWNIKSEIRISKSETNPKSESQNQSIAAVGEPVLQHGRRSWLCSRIVCRSTTRAGQYRKSRQEPPDAAPGGIARAAERPNVHRHAERGDEEGWLFGFVSDFEIRISDFFR